MSKDWTGDSNSVYKTLGASNHTADEREVNDYYATDPKAVEFLLTEGEVKLNSPVLECACGGGHLSVALGQFGYEVVSRDLIDRGFGETGIDFLKDNRPWSGDILTNPPYKYALEFIEHALELISEGHKVYMLLKLQFLEGKSRRKLFDKGQLKTVYIFSSRLLCAKNGDFESAKAIGGSAVAYAWYEFEKGYKGRPTIRWIA